MGGEGLSTESNKETQRNVQTPNVSQGDSMPLKEGRGPSNSRRL